MRKEKWWMPVFVTLSVAVGGVVACPVLAQDAEDAAAQPTRPPRRFLSWLSRE